MFACPRLCCSLHAPPPPSLYAAPRCILPVQNTIFYRLCNPPFFPPTPFLILCSATPQELANMIRHDWNGSSPASPDMHVTQLDSEDSEDDTRTLIPSTLRSSSHSSSSSSASAAPARHGQSGSPARGNLSGSPARLGSTGSSPARMVNSGSPAHGLPVIREGREGRAGGHGGGLGNGRGFVEDHDGGIEMGIMKG
ncbi:unnamed protein product [Closterium sp. NIES-54]